MNKILSIHDVWDTIQDDQRQFERTVAELKSRVANIAKSQKPDNIPSEAHVTSVGVRGER